MKEKTENPEHGDYVVCNDQSFASKLWHNRNGEPVGSQEFELVCHNVTVIEYETDNYDECFENSSKDIRIQLLERELFEKNEFIKRLKYELSRGKGK